MKDGVKVALGLFILAFAVFLKVSYFQDTLAFSGSFSRECNDQFLLSIGQQGDSQGMFKNGIGPFAVASNGDIYLADNSRFQILKFDSFGKYLYSLGRGDSWSDGQGKRPQEFDTLSALFVDDERVYVGDRYNKRVQIFDSSGNFLALVGDRDAPRRGTGSNLFSSNRLGTFAVGDSVLYLSDFIYPQLSSYIFENKTTHLFSSAGKQNGQFRYAVKHMAVHEDLLYVNDYGNHRIQVLDSQGIYVRKFGLDSRELPILGGVSGDVAIDKQGNVYVVDPANYRVLKFSPDGNLLLSFGKQGIGAGEFKLYPGRLHLDPQGNVWVSDPGTFRIHEFTSSGQYIKSLGGYGYGNGKFARGDVDFGFDSFGNLYVADYGSNRVQKFGRVC